MASALRSYVSRALLVQRGWLIVARRLRLAREDKEERTARMSENGVLRKLKGTISRPDADPGTSDQPPFPRDNVSE